ncbi:Hypothetical predicted protein [Mytilus galloprovincialis]|uniref:C1q domain-containing protein n=1 Tax=Mytilus galloprovincialis TaxID=29158 RepID=A0A8B6DPT8_MYTGA|nr:Hypothetical predicted protein [Mytilus galloprovincialis]
METGMVLVVVCFLAFFSKSLSFQQELTEIKMEGLREEVRNLTQRLQQLNTTLQKEKTGHIMFYAVIRGKSITYNVDTILVFETVIVNRGGLYNQYDGVFVADRKGMYMFSWTVSTSSSNWIVTELVVENQIISTAGVQNSGGGHPSGSMTAFCRMEMGDHAWIRSTGRTSSHVLYSNDNYPQSSFLGLLIYSE